MKLLAIGVFVFVLYAFYFWLAVKMRFAREREVRRYLRSIAME